MGTFELSGADGTYSSLVDLEAAPIIKDENRIGHVNKVFPMGAMGSLQAWLARTDP